MGDVRLVHAFFTCVARGHAWDVSPWREPGAMRCTRCGLAAEPVPHLH